MKNYSLGIGLVAGTLFCLLLMVSSCTSTKTSKQEMNALTVQLKEGFAASYLQKKYAAFNPSDINKSNRTLNQYRMNVSLNKKKLEELMLQMSNDQNIIEYSTSNNNGVEVSSGTNTGASKVGPIRNN